MRFLWLVTVLFVALAVFPDVAGLVMRIENGEFDFDMYQLLAASRQHGEMGYGRLSFFPNSAAGLDIWAWSHQYTSWFYSWTGWNRLDIWRFNIVVAVELIVALAASWLLTWEVVKGLKWPRLDVVWLWMAVIYDPLYHSFWLSERGYLRWVFIWGSLGLWIWWRSIRVKNVRYLWAFIGGLVTLLPPLSYASLGVPIMLGLIVAWIGEYAWSKRRDLSMLAVYVIGVLFAGGSWLVYVAKTVGMEKGWLVLKLVSGYNDLEWDRYLLELGYVIGSISVPLHGFSMLPIAVVGLIIGLVKYKDIDAQAQRVLRVAWGFIVVWLVMIFVSVPSHFYPARLTWLMPVFLVGLILVWRSQKGDEHMRILLTISAAMLVTGQALFQWWGAQVSVMTLAPIVLGVIVLASIWYGFAKRGVVNVPSVLVIVGLIAGIIYLPLVVEQSKYLYEGFVQERVRGDDGGWAYHSLQRMIRAEVLAMTDPNDLVLTNVPMREFFGDEIRLQAMSSNRGLFSGAMEVQADRVVLMGRKNKLFNDAYKQIDTGDRIYYRGFVYILISRIEIKNGLFILSGTPDDDKFGTIIKPAVFVSKDKVEDYFRWRAEIGG